ncbi:COF family HAD hydrolase protein [Mycoplasmopsis californica]|uniref:Cof-type HAD-IIB family hydrolase n=1 Tax=Mycoplasmopsis equigenitalium TaxID=114883 RepID=A0ABY5J2P8_9BACT|nr:Cof-type HAD-IIB family hydrolase [Mycoplasmopsis equigenitalium]UUD36999.1 Cof-type HAD-IIB family hydrolase [Mycoplasmopsis equigenitalium]VEU69703.1 COF family HAD hydrolase protein [Mycoplasmopsis californica]
MKKTKERYLFCIDIDGTLLENSAENIIHPLAKEAIVRATNEGHVVCLITGRPWRSTKPIYNKLGLDTVVANYNGAHIHNPSDDMFIPYIEYLDLNEMLYILGDPIVKEQVSNIAIEGPGWVQLQKRDHDLERVFGFKDAVKFVEGLNFEKLPLKPTGIVFDVKPTTDVENLRKYLKAKYGDLAEFSYWSKGDGLTPVFDITNVAVNKGRVISLLLRFYDIKIENSITIGDGFNDVSMFEVSGVSVAMKNASRIVRSKATVKLSKTNKEGGVGYYINKFLDNPESEKEKSAEIKRKWAEKELGE